MQSALKLNQPLHNFPLEDRLADVGGAFLLSKPSYNLNSYIGYHKASSIKTRESLYLQVRFLTYKSVVETATRFL